MKTKNKDRNKNKDIKYMREALRLAAKGLGKTSPNPMVGAVVVKGNRIVGRGYHKKAGLPHAEVNAIKKAGRISRGATLYVTLEPCSSHGRTPPCSSYIVDAGIKRVVIATKDPNPKNHHKGIMYLRRKSIKVTIGVLKKEATALNKAYNKFITTGLPYVTVKAAMSLDGKIATCTGSSKWISCKKSRQVVKKMRQEVDAVLVGRHTHMLDKPRLNNVKHKATLGSGDVNLREVLKSMAKMGISHVLIEGGGETIASAVNMKLVDRFCIFIAPKIIGGRGAPTPVEGRGIRDINDAIKLGGLTVEKIGSDILVKTCLQD